LSLFLASSRTGCSLRLAGFLREASTPAAHPVQIRIKPETRSALSLALTEPAVADGSEERSTLLRYCFVSQAALSPARSALFSCPLCHDSQRANPRREPVAGFRSTCSGSPQLNHHSLSGLRPSDQSTRSNVPPESLPKQTTVTRSLPGTARLFRPHPYRITVPGSFRSPRLTVP
jgi:hypothetical protein